MSERTPLSLAADGLLKAGKSPDPLYETPTILPSSENVAPPMTLSGSTTEMPSLKSKLSEGEEIGVAKESGQEVITL